MSTCRRSLFDSCPTGLRKRGKPAITFGAFQREERFSVQTPFTRVVVESRHSWMQVWFAPLPLSFAANRRRVVCLVFVRRTHRLFSSVHMRKFDMLRGIWKSIGKSQRYLSVYHAVPDKTVFLEKDLCVVKVEEANSCRARACLVLVTPGHSPRVQMSK
jgi:hypothetical protein